MKLQWQIRDVIDLEYFLHNGSDLREGADHSALSQTDRKIYLENIKPSLIRNKKSILDKKWIIRLWLEHKRDTVKTSGEDKILPGKSYQTVYWFMLLFTIAAGIAIGSAATLSFLFYKGISPINVSAFLGIFVLLQIALVLLTVVLSIMRKHIRLLHNLSITHSFLGALFGKLIFKLRETAASALPAKDRNRLMAAIGMGKGKHFQYGFIFFWPFFILMQVFAVCFNVGILLALILKVIVSDLAFGWQSTLQFSAQVIHQAVVLFSLPWSWFVPPDLAHPTIEQIEGSRIVLKDGIYHLSTSGMISWWPFLCFAIVFYGLLPRGILLLTGIIGHRRAMARIDFQTADCDRLIRNLTTPEIRTNGSSIEPAHDTESSPDPILQNGIPIHAPPLTGTGNSIIAIVPDDIDASCPEDELQTRIARSTGHKLIQKISFGADTIQSIESIKEILNLAPDNRNAGILVLQEAWQPPIREALLFLGLLRKTIGNQPIIRIGLIGKPILATIFTLPDPNDIAVWKQAIASLGDPAMTVDILGGKS
ncbi:MAG: hypothetical protein C0403_10400 [Desulfobacterium sp.]|nr:hypothetical protein [Desulfobacterium sp.]